MDGDGPNFPTNGFRSRARQTLLAADGSDVFLLPSRRCLPQPTVTILPLF